MVKAPKLYFIDTGLAAWLLGIREQEQLAFHTQRGALFENLVMTEFLKGRFNKGQPADLSFWRDNKRLEVDLVLDDGNSLKPVEIKSGQTVVPDFMTSTRKWCEISGIPNRPAWLVYGGTTGHANGNIAIVSWSELATLATL
jgi:predicted AAA+ superfamily ATPase